MASAVWAGEGVGSLPVYTCGRARLLRRLGMAEQAPHLRRFYGFFAGGPLGPCPVQAFDDRYRATLEPAMPRGLPPNRRSNLPALIRFP